MTDTLVHPVDLIADVPTGLLIGGEWTPSADGRTFGVDNPATGEPLVSIADASPADAVRALDAAVAAAADWAAPPPGSEGRSSGGRTTCCRSAKTSSRC